MDLSSTKKFWSNQVGTCTDQIRPQSIQRHLKPRGNTWNFYCGLGGTDPFPMDLSATKNFLSNQMGTGKDRSTVFKVSKGT